MIYKNVSIGSGAVIEDGVIIGVPPYGKVDGELPTIIGKNAYIRAYTIIYAGTRIGDNFQTGPSVLIREENRIGDNVVVWHKTTLNPGNKIGDGTRIHAGCFLEMSTLGKNVFFGPNVTITDDPHPIIPIQYRDCWKGATIKDHAVIGGGVTLLPHVKIGQRAVVGAGAVVTGEIPSFMVAVGNPARVVKRVWDIECTRTGKKHKPWKISH